MDDKELVELLSGEKGQEETLLKMGFFKLKDVFALVAEYHPELMASFYKVVFPVMMSLAKTEEQKEIAEEIEFFLDGNIG